MLLPTFIRNDKLSLVRRRLVSKSAVSYETVVGGVAALDLLTITISSTLAQFSYVAMSAFESYDWFQAFGIGLMCGVLYIPIVRSFGGYSLPVLIEPTRVAVGLR